MAKDFAKFYAAGMEYHDLTESSRAMLAAMLNMSEEEAEQMAAQIEQVALDTTLDPASAYSMASTLLAYGTAPEELIDQMLMFYTYGMGDSAMAMRIGKAFAQLRGKTKLFAQEGYQFTEAYVPIWDILEQYYASDEFEALWKAGLSTGNANPGITKEDILANLNQKGDNIVIIPYEDVAAAMQWYMENSGYASVLEKIQGTHTFQLERVAETAQAAAAAFATPFADYETTTVLPAKVANALKRLELFEQHEGLLSRYAQMWGDLQIGGSNAMTAVIEGWLYAEDELPGALPLGLSFASSGLGSYLSSSGASGLKGLLARGSGGLFSALGAFGTAFTAFDMLYGMRDKGLGLFEKVAQLEADGISISDLYAEAVASGASERELIELGRMLIADSFMDDPLSVYPDYVANKLANGEELTGWEQFVKDLADWGAPLAASHALLVPPDIEEGAETGEPKGATTDDMPQWLYNFLDSVGLIVPPDIPAPVEEEDDEVYKKKYSPFFGGGGGIMETTFLEDGGIHGASSLMTTLQNMPQQITAAVQQGFSGATITVNVTTGDVRLDDGTLAAKLAPRVDAALGILNARAARG